MKSNPSGAYWCNHCDDNAYSARCWRCHREATWIPATAATVANVPDTTVRYITPPAEWFRRMRQAINK